MVLASVILDIPAQALDVPYSYIVPENAADLKVGCAVLVPFGHRVAMGYVVSVQTLEKQSQSQGSKASSSPEVSKMKEIAQVLSASFFDEYAAACARFLSDNYVAPLSSCIRLFLPPTGAGHMVKQKGKWQFEKPTVGPVDDRWVRRTNSAKDFKAKKTAVKQGAVMDALLQGELRVAELAVEFGAISAVLKTLEKKGVIEIEHRRRMRGNVDTFTPSKMPALTKGQKNALEVILKAQNAACGEVVLVDGVTGSGKTEVYLQAIARELARGKGAIVLVPEISLTPQTVARFRGRFGDTVAVLHSKMSPGERFDQWDKIRSGDAKVVVGARSALFAPLASLGLIVIDEEHESTYKQSSAPRYVARDVAAWMAKKRGATLVLGSATPSIETLHRCRREKNYSLVCLSDRVNGQPLPQIEVVDRAGEFGSGHRSMFSRPLARALFDVIDAGHKAVLLLNQRGFAKFVLCRDCGFVPECPACSLSLTYHDLGSVLFCHHCGFKMVLPLSCPQCKSPYLKLYGAGTERVEADLKVLLAEKENATIIRMDADTTSKKGSHQKLLEQFGSQDSAILLGTQMIAKGLDFDEVTLVGVINADTMLKLPDFRSAERTFNLIEQVAGRAGRAHLPGKVIVQTYLPDDMAIKCAAAYDRQSFLVDELSKRKALGYPPYTRLGNVLIWGKNNEDVKEVACSIAKDIEKLLSEIPDSSKSDKTASFWRCLGAVPCVLAKRRNLYRWHILIKAPLDADISAVLLPLFRNRKAQDNVHVALDIDPFELL
jgi:primosomal protein N' (replication factor Y)